MKAVKFLALLPLMQGSRRKQRPQTPVTSDTPPWSAAGRAADMVVKDAGRRVAEDVLRLQHAGQCSWQNSSMVNAHHALVHSFTLPFLLTSGSFRTLNANCPGRLKYGLPCIGKQLNSCHPQLTSSAWVNVHWWPAQSS